MIYRLFVDYDLVSVIDRLPPNKRRRLKEHFQQLKNFPGNLSDHTHIDADGMLLHVSLFDDFAVFYWIDDADRHVKIMRIAEQMT